MAQMPTSAPVELFFGARIATPNRRRRGVRFQFLWRFACEKGEEAGVGRQPRPSPFIRRNVRRSSGGCEYDGAETLAHPADGEKNSVASLLSWPAGNQSGVPSDILA
jgi:hypothetical protein